MQVTAPEFKYEVAFSFLKQDEALATSLNDLISDRLSTFLYSKRQGEVAGRDGEELFNKVFGHDSRIVVILYREGWGSSAWTRIEETAIKNRAYNSGYGFVVVISMTKPATLPSYIPLTYLYVSFDRFGKEGAAAVIEDRVKTAGGAVRIESAIEQAMRVQRREEFLTKRTRFLTTEVGIQAAAKSAVALVNCLESSTLEILAHSSLKIEFERFSDAVCEVRCGAYYMSVGWGVRYVNTLEGTYLSAQLSLGPPNRPGRYVVEDPKYLKKHKFRFDIDDSDAQGWREGDSNHLMDAEQLAGHIVRQLLQQMEAGK